MDITPEEFWGELLSREPARIVAAWRMLSADEQSAVWDHLQRMVTEDGWLEPQQLSAQAAIETISNIAE